MGIFAITGQVGFYVALGFCQSDCLSYLVGLFALHAIACGALIATGPAMPGKLFGGRRGLAQGFTMAGSSLSGLMLSGALPRIYQHFAWTVANAIMASIVGGIGMLSLLCVFPYSVVLPEEARTVKGERSKTTQKDLQALLDFKSLLECTTWAKHSSYAWFVGGMFWLEIGLFGISATIPFIEDSLGGVDGHASWVLMSLCAGSLLGRLSAGFIADMFGHFETLVCGGAFTIGTLLFVYFTLDDGNIGVFYFSAVSWGLATGSWIPMFGGCIRVLAPVKEYGKFFGELKLSQQRYLH